MLQNVRIDGDHAELTLDGQLIRLHGDSRSPALVAVRELHALVRADYDAWRSRAGQRSRLLGRFRSWLGGILGRNRQTRFASNITDAGPSSGELSFGQRQVQTCPRGGMNPAQLEAIFADTRGVHVVWQENWSASAGETTTSTPPRHN